MMNLKGYRYDPKSDKATLMMRNVLPAGTMQRLHQQGQRPTQCLVAGAQWLMERALLPAELAAQLTAEPSAERNDYA